jgi:branched-subunit amino acid aminotransferase/4-amino-4-deoxychorismate lyase
MSGGDLPCWVDGQLVPSGAPALPADDSAFLEGRGCYTTARIRSGRALWADRHARRLERDARRLEIGEVDPEQVLRVLTELGRAAFGPGEGIVRVQASRSSRGKLHLVGIPRELGPEPRRWAARTAPFPHQGPMPWSGAKVTSHLLTALAAASAREAGLDEALLLDSHGYLVEGARSNLVLVGPTGTPATPDLARGGVAGIAREILCERVALLERRDIVGTEVGQARELIAVNAVRGARPIVRVDGSDVANGEPGPWARRLDDILSAE